MSSHIKVPNKHFYSWFPSELEAFIDKLNLKWIFEEGHIHRKEMKDE